MKKKLVTGISELTGGHLRCHLEKVFSRITSLWHNLSVDF